MLKFVSIHLKILKKNNMKISEIRSYTQGYDIIYIYIDNNNINDFFDFFEFAKQKGYTEISIDENEYSSKKLLKCKRYLSKEEFKQLKIDMFKKDIEIATKQLNKLLQNED
jgi:hypothetical protein